MNIITPIRSLEELEMLIANGADELYCGLKTREWDEIFSENLWMNRRNPDQANITSLKDLETLIAVAHEHAVKVSITLNAPFYPENGMAYMLTLCSRLADMGVDALIVSDLNLLVELSRLNLGLRIHLSSLGACFNSFSVPFYKSLGVKRVILPRQLTLPEIKAIVTKHRDDMEFEVFAVNDGCYFEESFCQTSHTLGAFCLTDWTITPLETDSPGTGNETVYPDLAARLAHFKTYLWYQNNCGSSFQQDGLPNGPCSLCQFGDFRDWGVSAVKIVGREASFHRKMGSLQLVKAVRDKARQTQNRDRIIDYARQLRQTPEYCDSGYMCYFGPCFREH
jgi:putative protease